MIFNSNAGLLLLRERHTMSRPVGVSHLSPTAASHASKHLSHCRSAPTPNASRYQRSLPSRCAASCAQSPGASGDELCRKSMEHSRLTWAEEFRVRIFRLGTKSTISSLAMHRPEKLRSELRSVTACPTYSFSLPLMRASN